MKRLRLTIGYDGTHYAGWQVQLANVTVQSELQRCLKRFCGDVCILHCSGRTDAGVHAMGQVAHIDIERDVAAVNVQRALNSSLPHDIRVYESEEVAPDFHARYWAKSKEYRYFVWNTEIMPPEKRLYATHIRRPLNLRNMQLAAERLIGRHDFATFSANPHRYVETTVRTVFGFEILQEGASIEFRVVGSGFLYKMVRSLVGYLLQVGCGAETPESVDDVFAVGRRTERVLTAHAHGLFLWQVNY